MSDPAPEPRDPIMAALEIGLSYVESMATMYAGSHDTDAVQVTETLTAQIRLFRLAIQRREDELDEKEDAA